METILDHRGDNEKTSRSLNKSVKIIPFFPGFEIEVCS